MTPIAGHKLQNPRTRPSAARFADNRCNRTFGTLTSTVGALEAGHLGKFGQSANDP